jgi:hypothetical protein
MSPKEMYNIEKRVIEIGDSVDGSYWLKTLPNCDKIVAEVRNNSGKYGDTLLIACDLIYYAAH